MDPIRSQRVAEGLREELDEMIAYELEDPRIAPTRITEVLVSPDGKKARIRVSIEGDADAQATTLAALAHAKSYLKSQIGARMTLFRIPELEFENDMSAGLSQKAKSVLKRMKRGRARDEGSAADASDE